MGAAPENGPQATGAAPGASHTSSHSTLYRSAARNRRSLRPQRHTYAPLTKQILRSSFNPRYRTGLQRLGVTVSPGVPLSPRQLSGHHQPPCSSVCFLESSLDSSQRMLR